MEPLSQLEAWQQQIAENPDASAADLDVAKRLVRHGIEALKEIAMLRRDAERYRWVRENGYLLIEEDRGIGPMWPHADKVDALVDSWTTADMNGANT